jgi:hypothetical protein
MLVNKLVSNIGCEEIAIYYTNLIGCIMSKGQSDIYKQNGKGIMGLKLTRYIQKSLIDAYGNQVHFP